jgi:hypothetical protein
MINSQVVQNRLVIFPIFRGWLLIVPSRKLVICDRIPITALVKQQCGKGEMWVKLEIGKLCKTLISQQTSFDPSFPSHFSIFYVLSIDRNAKCLQRQRERWFNFLMTFSQRKSSHLTLRFTSESLNLNEFTFWIKPPPTPRKFIVAPGESEPCQARSIKHGNT